MTVEIAVYKNHISFINHNRPLPPVTIADLNEQTVFADRQYVNDELKEMFFKLDLIQSYGSGIRRAKNAMSVNGSPKLVFTPNNDMDDYTLAVAYINEEFARIQEEEDRKHQGNTQEIAQEIAQENIQESVEDQIVELIIQKPEITRRELAIQLGITPDNVKYRLNKLKSAGRIEHRGATKSGKWIVLK